MLRSVSIILAVGAGLSAAGVAHGVPAYATNTIGDEDTLIAFDTDDPSAYTTIGPLGVPDISFGGLDVDAEGNLWAYATLYRPTGGAASGLYQVDPVTGQATPVGSSLQTLQDLAYNPVDGKMYGVNTQFAAQTKLYEIDLASGTVTSLGVVAGLPAQHFINGLAIDSTGAVIMHDVLTDRFFKSTGGDFSLLYDLPQDTNFGQGMTIDWSRDDTGYHGAAGYGNFPNFFSQLNTFAPDGSSYVLGDAFGPNRPDGGVPVQTGDVAVVPIPAPGAAVVFALTGLAAGRRRR